jgi:polyribonucleotide nucleotidyltransferase
MNEVQIVCTTVSCNPEIDPDIPAMIGASAALAISGIPFDGPIGAARVGYINGQLCVVSDQIAIARKHCSLTSWLLVQQPLFLMVESEAKQLSEEIMLGCRSVWSRANARCN